MILDHIGIAVAAMDEALALYKTLGFSLLEQEQVAAFQVDVAMLDAGGAKLELLAPTGAGAIQTFIEKRGPGMHHMAFAVADIESELARLHSAGHRLIDQTPRPGFGGHMVAFLHPKSTMGALIELVQT